jgi:hypothetical protein
MEESLQTVAFVEPYMVLEDEVSCVVERLYVYVSVGHDVGVGLSLF